MCKPKTFHFDDLLKRTIQSGCASIFSDHLVGLVNTKLGLVRNRAQFQSYMFQIILEYMYIYIFVRNIDASAGDSSSSE